MSLGSVLPPQPQLKVLRGAPTDEELGALVIAVTLGTARSSVSAISRSPWRSRGRNIRPAIGPGPGAWRASGLPR